MTNDLHVPFEDVPAPGTVREVAPGLHWVRMPLPFALDHVNLWLLDDAEGWTLVDTGLGNAATKDLWRGLLAGPVGGRPIARVVATHFHPDHVGLAGWFAAEHGAPLWMPRTEWLTGRMLSETGDEAGAEQAAFFRTHGLPDAAAESLSARGNAYRRRAVPLPTEYRRIRGGDVIEAGRSRWQVVVGEGHAPEQACLYGQDLGVLIAGDQILPRITPNVSVGWFEPEADPLADFLASLRRFRTLPEETLVLPSHGSPFVGLHRRIASLEGHHAQRLADVARACRSADGRTAFELLDVLFRRRLDEHQIVFAMGEAIAHLAYLERDGALKAETTDGVRRYRA